MSDDVQDVLGRGFDAAAADFDALGVHVWGPIGAATVEATCPVAGERVLDACCGTGASALPTAAAVGSSGTVHAVDISSSMIDVLNQSAATLPQLHGYAADVLAWDGRGYDVVQAVLGIFFFSDMAAGTERLVQSVRPGGRVGFTIWRAGAMEVPGRYLEKAIAGVTRTDPRPRGPHPLAEVNDPSAYRAWLGERGLSDVDVRVDERRLALTEELGWLIVTGSGFRGALASLTPGQVAEVRERYLASLAGDGVAEVDASTLIGTGTRPAGRAG